MPITHQQRVTASSNSLQVTGSIDLSGDTEVNVIETLAAGATNINRPLALDVSQVVSFAMIATQACVVKTNSSGSPANTINLVANVPYIWNSQSYDAFKLTTDVTALFLTNSSGTLPCDFRLVALSETP